MNAPENNETGNIATDRGIPSVAIPLNNQKLFGAVLLGLAGITMIFVVASGMDRNTAKTLTEPKEVAFRSPGGAAPYIAAEAPQNADPLAAQKDIALQQEALRMAKDQQKKLAQRNQSPQVVYDQPSAAVATNTNLAASGAAADMISRTGKASISGSGADDPNIAFASQNADKGIETAQASQIQNLDTLIAQGAMISGILETALQSDLPGMARAIVSENIYSFDGAKLLIPQGSRLIGQYRSGLVRGQSRVFVIWNRLIRNDGVSINIGSYGTDDLGRSGLEGDVDTHFFERFGSSVLLSMIDSGLQIGAASANDRDAATVAVNTGNDFSRAAEIALQNSIAIPPTINVNQGTRIKVFVGKDLDFSHVAGNLPGLTPP
jgi:type IV secretion system protein VirB10